MILFVKSQLNKSKNTKKDHQQWLGWVSLAIKDGEWLTVTLKLLLMTFFDVIYLYCQDLYNNTSDVVRVLTCLWSFFFLSSLYCSFNIFFFLKIIILNNNIYKKIDEILPLKKFSEIS